MGAPKQKENDAIIVREDGLIERNLQTHAADASTAISEAIDNPGYRDSQIRKGYRSGIMIRRIRVYTPLNDVLGVAHGAYFYHATQLHTGDTTATNALKDMSDNQLFAHASVEQQFTTGVGIQVTKLWPLDVEVLFGLPVIVTPKYTVQHKNNVDIVAFRSKNLWTVIDYALVDVQDSVFTTMLMNQSRTS